MPNFGPGEPAVVSDIRLTEPNETHGEFYGRQTLKSD